MRSIASEQVIACKKSTGNTVDLLIYDEWIASLWRAARWFR